MPTRPLSHSQRLGRMHADKAYDQTRRAVDPALAQAKQIRSRAQWRRLRAIVLGKQPLCADPWGVHARTGRVEVATEVDHIVGLREAPALAYTESNLQGLCSACHARKSKAERRGQ